VVSEWFVTVSLECGEERASAPDHDHVGRGEVSCLVGPELLSWNANAAVPQNGRLERGSVRSIEPPITNVTGDDGLAAVRFEAALATSITLDVFTGDRTATGGTLGELFAVLRYFNEVLRATTLATLAARSRRATRDATAHPSSSRSLTDSTSHVVEFPL
jgi:hypothetical protein